MNLNKGLPVRNKVKAGYKKTEIGIIPVDWKIHKIGDITVVYVGRDLKIENYSTFQDNRYNYPVYSNTVDNEGLYGFYDFAEYVGESLTIVGRGVGLGTAFTRKGGYGAIGRLLVLFPNKSTNPHFLSEYINNRLDFFEESGGIPQLTGVKLRNYRIPLPPTLEEQRVIATALSDTDELISSLDKLITKKCNIKQATMQQLLTGKKRLPGFSGEWEVKKLCDIGKTYGGLSGKSKIDFEDGENPYIPFMNIMSNTVIDKNYLDYVNIKIGETQNMVAEGDLFFNGSSETPEEVGMCAVLLDYIPNLYLNSFCFGFRLKKGIKTDGLFLSYLFRSPIGRSLIFSSAQGATRYNLSKRNFLELEILLPRYDEQQAITQVLSDMDTEIESLEQKRDKYKAIKQGMMQQLLTGKTRLV